MSLSATMCLLRGKCNVTLLNETDVLVGYLDKEVRHHLYIFHVFIFHIIKTQVQ